MPEAPKCGICQDYLALCDCDLDECTACDCDLDECTAEDDMSFDPSEYDEEPDGYGQEIEGEVVDPSYFVGGRLVTNDPTISPREADNIRDAAIREAAQQVLDDLDIADQGPVAWDTPEAAQAFEDIKYKLKWIVRTGLGVRDIV